MNFNSMFAFTKSIFTHNYNFFRCTNMCCVETVWYSFPSASFRLNLEDFLFTRLCHVNIKTWVNTLVNITVVNMFTIAHMHAYLIPISHDITRPIISHAITHDNACNDDVIKCKRFLYYWPLVRGVHRSPVVSFTKGQQRGLRCFLWC